MTTCVRTDLFSVRCELLIPSPYLRAYTCVPRCVVCVERVGSTATESSLVGRRSRCAKAARCRRHTHTTRAETAPHPPKAPRHVGTLDNRQVPLCAGGPYTASSPLGTRGTGAKAHPHSGIPLCGRGSIPGTAELGPGARHVLTKRAGGRPHSTWRCPRYGVQLGRGAGARGRGQGPGGQWERCRVQGPLWRLAISRRLTWRRRCDPAA